MVVLSVLIVLDVLLFLPQEMMLRLKNKISKMNKIFFIFSSIPKGLGVPNVYHDLVRFTRIVDFTWRVSDCEELVGEVSHKTKFVILIF